MRAGSLLSTVFADAGIAVEALGATLDAAATMQAKRFLLAHVLAQS